MSVFVILNHELTPDQSNDLTAKFGEVVTLTPDQKKLWSQIPTEGDYYGVQKHVEPIVTAIAGHDAVVCQGEFTAFAVILDHCRGMAAELGNMSGLPVLVACSRRETVETVGQDGTVTKTAVFRHVQFREV